MIRVDQRVITLTIPPQEVITRDNVPARCSPLPVDIITPFLGGAAEALRAAKRST